MSRKLGLDVKVLEERAAVLKAMAHPLRIAMIDLLNEHGELSVSQVHEMIAIEQATASHHLGILRTKGILASRREGKSILYSLKFDKLHQIVDCVKNFDAPPG